MNLLLFLLVVHNPFTIVTHTSMGIEMDVDLMSPPKSPVSTMICIPQNGEVTLTAIPLDSEIIKGAPPIITRDVAPAINEEYNIKPPVIAELEVLGTLRDYRVAGITVFPYRRTGDNTLFYKKIAIAVKFGQSAVEKKEPPPSGFDDVYENTILNYQYSRRWSVERKGKKSIWKPEGVRLETKEDGIYRVTYEELRNAGISLSGIDPTTIKIKNLGQEIPIFVRGEEDGSFDEGDYIEFYGEFPRGNETYLYPYAQNNVYWFSFGGSIGQRLIKENGSLENPERAIAYAFPCTLHMEKDLLFSRHAQDDYWFYTLASMGARREIVFDIDTPDSLSFEPTKVTVELYGRTEDEHNAILSLGESYIGTANWWGEYSYTLETQGPTNDLLTAGKNEFELICQGPEDYIYLNYFELVYKRSYRAVDDYIEFGAPGGGVWEFRVEGFSSPNISLYRLDHSRFTEFDVEFDEVDTTYTLIFEDDAYTDTRYVALTEDRIKTPDITVPSYDRDLTTIGEVNYVIIAYDSLKEACERYKEFRESKYSVEIITTEEVYDYFGYGLVSADAIREFLKFAYTNWNTSLCLLVGDGVDNKHIPYGTSGNLIPVKMEDTEKWGYTASDDWYACVSGKDIVPDILLGRLPMRTEEDVASYLRKVKDYEEYPEYGGWKRDVLFISGVGGVYATTFKEQIDELIDDFTPSCFFPFHIEAPISTPQDVIEEINEGRSIVLFKGHGGGRIWSDNAILDLDDVNLLDNGGRLPCVLSFTCFTTSFDGGLSLGEAFLQNGGICCYGASGVGWFWNDMYLAQELLSKIWDGNLGTAIVSSKASYLSKYQFWGNIPSSQVKQYLLLGDPVLTLSFPDTMSLDVTPKYVDTGGDIIVSAKGKMDIDISSSGVIHYRDTIMGDTTITLPEGIEGRAKVRGYLLDTDEAGATYIEVGAPYIGEPKTVPESPESGDSVWVLVYVEYPETVPVILTYWKGGIPPTEIPMVEDSLFMTTSPIYVQAGDRIYYCITAGEEISDTFSLYIPGLADISVIPVAFFGWEDGVYLSTKVENLGETAAESVVVSAHLETRVAGSRLDHQLRDTIFIPPDSSRIASFKWNFPAGIYDVYFIADPDSQIEEENKNNNWSDTFEIRADVHMTTDTGCSFKSIDENILVEIPPGAVSGENAVWIDGAEFSPTYQPDIFPVSLPGHPGGWVYKLTLLDTSMTVNEGKIGFLMYDTLGDYAIYRWYEDRWTYLPPTTDSTMIYGELLLPGRYTLIRSNDDISPGVEVLSDGRSLRDGGYVSEKPKIDVVFEDVNGIDPRSIAILIDSVQYDTSCNHSSSIDKPASLILSFSPELTKGRHSLYVKCGDCNGNTVETQRKFEVKGKLDILSFGNYPNPVRGNDRETVFAFLLSDRADELRINVYTIAGRRIWRHIEYFPSADWEKINWDLTDDEMRTIANGVYFYEVIVRKGDSEVKKRGKLAVLK